MSFLLLRPHFLTLKNKLTHGAKARFHLQRDLLLLATALLTMLCIYVGFQMVFSNLEENPLFAAIIPAKLIELLYFAFFLVLLLSSSVAAIGNIYSATNMDFYLTYPIPASRLYLSKLIPITFESGIMFLVFGLPAATAYVTCLGVDPTFILTALVVSIPFLLIPVGLSIIFSTVFVILSAKLWRRGLILLVVLGGSLVYVFLRFVDMLQSVDTSSKGKLALVKTISLFDNPSPIWLPSRWAADILVSYVGNPEQALAWNAILLFSTSLAAIACGYLCFDFLMFRIRSTASSSTSQGRYAEVDITRKIVEFLYRWFPLSDQTRALVVKDLTCLVRDRGQALQLLLFVGISMAYLMLFKFASIGLSFDAIAAEQAWRAFLACMNFLFVGFILTAVMTRLVYPSVSLEGRAFWILLVAPIQLRNMIEAKYRCWLPFTISFAVMLLTTGSIALELPIESWLVSAVIGTLLALGCTGMATGLGALFASFEWESPNQVTAGLGTLVLFLCSLLMVVTLFVPVSLATALAASSEVRLALASYASRLPIFDGAASLVYNIAPGATLLICMAVSALITVGISWWARSSGSRALARQTFE